MDNQDLSAQRKWFVSNMMESAIRIGLLFILIVWTYDIVRPFVIPVLWGAIIAVALMPLTHRLERAFKGRRGLAAVVLAVLGIVLLVTPVVVVSGSIFDGVARTIEVLQSGNINIPGPTQRVAEIPLIGDKLFEGWSSIASNVEKAILQFLPEIKSTFSTLAGLIGSSLLTLVMFIISLLIAAGFMANAESCASAVSKVAVRAVGPDAKAWTSLTAATIRSVLLGVVGVAFIQTMIMGLALFVFGIPLAGLLTLVVLFMGIAQLPALIIVLPLIGYAYSTMDGTSATIFSIWVLLGGLSDNVLKPMLMGRGVDVPMPVILIGAIGGMLTAGIIGLFLGAVILAIWYELFITWLGNGEVAEQEGILAGDSQETGDK
ncbi:AI-2E family transporter [Shewanella psychrotolerans]|uniref:AI-2E family transporter n=1 Tax=Shewanella psychrotolerans TaxID=2864206 RepID=UPI001C65B515|nr:AI-2E family transporter [Shewanella psychrotolerans]QYK02037.1 AI-2E family transporter [Shewanella psychrotolerans]